MIRAFSRKALWLIPLALAAWWGAHAWPPPRPTTTGKPPATANVLDENALRHVTWDRIGPLVQSLGAAPEKIRRAIRFTEGSDKPEAAYLRGLLLLASRKPELALQTFDGMNAEAIPPGLLYAPHRLQEMLRPREANPYLTRLRQAVAEGRAPALVRARIQTRDGALKQALESYLQSDPGLWTGRDMDNLQRLHRHQGLQPDVRRILAGAIQGGRLSPLLRQRAREAAQRSPEGVPEGWRRTLADHPDAAQFARAALEEMLKVRQRFLAREYADLLKDHREREAASLPNETLLMLFLAAGEQGETVDRERWGQEIQRRRPEPEVAAWVGKIMGTTR